MMIRVITRVINENKGTQRMYINLMTSAKTFNEYLWIISYLKLNRTVIIYIHIAVYLSIAYTCKMTDTFAVYASVNVMLLLYLRNSWYNWKAKNTTLSKQCQNYIPLAHKYMIAHFPGLVQALQLKVDGVSHGSCHMYKY